MKKLWHRMWGLAAYPIEIHRKWWQYFRKDVREYVKTCQRILNSPAALKLFDEAMHDQLVFGVSLHQFADQMHIKAQEKCNKQ